MLKILISLLTAGVLLYLTFSHFDTFEGISGLLIDHEHLEIDELLVVLLILLLSATMIASYRQRQGAAIRGHLQRREKFDTSLLKLSRILEQAVSYEAVIDAVTDAVRSETGYPMVWIYLSSEEEADVAHLLTVSEHKQSSSMIKENLQALKISDDPFIEAIFALRIPLVIDDARLDPRTDKQKVDMMQNRTLVHVPITLTDQYLGVMGTGSFADEGVKPPIAEELLFLESVANHLAITINRLYLLEMRAKAEKEVEESRENYKSVLQSARITGWEYDLRSESFVFISSEAEQLSGHPIQAWQTPDFWSQHIHPEDRERVISCCSKALSDSDSSYSQEYRFKTASGDYIWLKDSFRVTSDDIRKGIFEDVTSLKQSEFQFEKMRLAIEQFHDPLIITDQNACIEYVNPAFSRLTGYTSEEIIGQSTVILNSGHQDTEFYREMWDTIRAGNSWQRKLINKKKDGSSYPAELSISPVQNEAGNLSGFLAVQKDLTDIENVESQLRQAQKMDAIGTLVGGIAHDFNNMLAGMTGQLYLAKMDAASLPSVVGRIDKIESLSYRAADMIQQLLAFSRKSTINKKAMSLSAFVKDIVTFHRASIPENIQLDFQACDEDIRVRGDKTQLQQVLMNLINNARDALVDTPSPTISVTLAEYSSTPSFTKKYPELKSKRFASISISDNGHGIDEQHLEKVFEPFFTTKAVGEGTGLGLAMVYGIVTGHGGVIEVYSKQAEGTLVSIYLPLIEAKALLDDAAAQYKFGHGELILLVDDDLLVVETCSEVLKSLNYKVLTAQNGREAVELYRLNSDSISVVLIDVVMPEMGGVDAVREIRALNPRVRVIYATGYDRTQSVNIEGDGAEAVLSKPLKIGELSNVLHDAIRE